MREIVHRHKMHVYGTLIVYGIALALCAFALHSCKGIQGGVIGGGTGAALTGTPQGAGIGAAAGFVVGLWNDITTAVSGWWSNLWGHPEVPAPSQSGRIWTWLLLLALLGFALKFAYHFVWDAEFRAHILKLFKLKTKKKALHADPAP